MYNYYKQLQILIILISFSTVYTYAIGIERNLGLQIENPENGLNDSTMYDESELVNHNEIDANDINSMPVETVSDILNLQPGVIVGYSQPGELFPNPNQDSPYHYGDGIGSHIMGNSWNEQTYYINGIPINDCIWEVGRQNIEIGAINKIKMHTGVFSARYGNSGSGIIDIITHKGADTHSVRLSGLVGNYLTSESSIFPNINNFRLSGLQDYQLSLRGPFVPSKKIQYFVNGRIYNNDGHIFGKRYYIPSDSGEATASGNGTYVPMSLNKRWSLFGNLTFMPIKNLSFLMFLNYTNSEKKYYYHDMRRTPDGIMTHYRNNLLFGFNVDHRISDIFSHSFKGSISNSDGKGYLYENPLDSRYYISFFSTPRDDDNFLIGGNNLRRYDFNFGTFSLLWEAEVKIAEQNLSFGLERQSHSVSLEEKKMINTANPPFDSLGNPIIHPGYSELVSSHNYPKDTYKPVKISVYIEDRYSIGVFSLQAGLRYEHFNPNADMYADLEDPLGYLTPTTDRFKPTATKSAFSPRLNIEININPFFASAGYGIFYHTAPFQYYYSNRQLNSRFTLDNAVLGNPDLDLLKTTRLNLTLGYKLWKYFPLKVTFFTNKKNNSINLKRQITKDLIGYYLYHVDDDLQYRTKGLVFEGSVKISDQVDFSLSYMLQNTEYTHIYNIPSFISYSENRPAQWDQKHTISAAMNLRIPGDVFINTTWLYGSGKPYNPLFTEPLPPDFKIDYDKFRTPATQYVNIKLRKSFMINNLQLDALLIVYNLFDRYNELSVDRISGRSEASQEFVQLYGVNYLIRPDYYSTPRLIKMGFELSL